MRAWLRWALNNTNSFPRSFRVVPTQLSLASMELSDPAEYREQKPSGGVEKDSKRKGGVRVEVLCTSTGVETCGAYEVRCQMRYRIACSTQLEYGMRLSMRYQLT